MHPARSDLIPRIGSALYLSAPPPHPSSAPNAPSTLAMSATEPKLTTAHADAPSTIRSDPASRLGAVPERAAAAPVERPQRSFDPRDERHGAEPDDGARGCTEQD